METGIDTIVATLALGRWVHFAALFILFGTAMFDLAVNPSEPPDRTATGGAPASPPALAYRLTAVVAACSGIAWLAGTIARASDGWTEGFDPATLRVFFLETPFGAPFAARLVLMVLLLGSAVRRLPPRVRTSCNLCLGGLLLVSQAWLGHAMAARTTGLQALMVLTYVAHVLGAATWIGSLPILAYTLRVGDWDETIPTILRRYTTMATVAVILVVGSGIANTGFHAGTNIEALPTSPYGQMLLVKISLVVVMLGLAAWNRHLGRKVGGGRTETRLRKNVILEFGVAFAILGVTALLGMTPPPQ